MKSAHGDTPLCPKSEAIGDNTWNPADPQARCEHRSTHRTSSEIPRPRLAGFCYSVPRSYISANHGHTMVSTRGRTAPVDAASMKQLVITEFGHHRQEDSATIGAPGVQYIVSAG